MRSFLIAAVALCVGQAAQAADLPFLRGSFQDGPIAPRAMWEGFYVGGQAGYGSTVANIAPGTNSDLIPSTDAASLWPTLQSPQANNTGFGAFAGYNTQWEDVVVGLEANYMHGRYNTVASAANSLTAGGVTTTRESRAAINIEDFGSLRLRAGYVAGNFLPYAFVGGGVGNMVVERSTRMTPVPGTPLFATDTKSNLVYGYSAGLGVDILLVAGLFVRAEYEYQRITSKDIDANVNSARLGVGYKF